jgi:hypothetical protein
MIGALPIFLRNIYLVDTNAYFARPGPRIVDSLEILAGVPTLISLV